MRAAAKHALPILPLLPSFSSFPSVSEQNGGPKKAQKSDDRLAKKYEFGIPSPEMTSLFFNKTLHLMTHLHYFSFEFPPPPLLSIEHRQ